jgi:hypothetical protein
MYSQIVDVGLINLQRVKRLALQARATAVWKTRFVGPGEEW